MAQHLFKLAPDSGRAALPRLLELASARGLYVEVVALADTQGLTFDLDTHVSEVGRIVAEHGNAFLEIANEPGHPTQDRRLHDPAVVAKLAALIPDRVLVAFGSVEYGDGYSGGDYVTFHSSRGTREWDHVTALADGARLMERFHKPIINDEPIGAATDYQAGRRDNEPSRFAAAGALSRFVGLGATFHYEDGLQARIPTGRQAACLAAWMTGLALAGHDGDEAGAFLADAASVARVTHARAAYARVSSKRARLLVIDPSPSTTITWQTPWVEASRTAVTGVLLVNATR
jgi:hypothetical protein